MRAWSWAVVVAGVACATGCKVTLVQESVERPPEARLEMWAECIRDTDEYWTDVIIQNNSDVPVMIRPDSFQLTGGDERPMKFRDWAYFGGSRYTLGRPRPLQPGKRTDGRVRWEPSTMPPTVRLQVEIEGETWAWVFREP